MVLVLKELAIPNAACLLVVSITLPEIVISLQPSTAIPIESPASLIVVIIKNAGIYH